MMQNHMIGANTGQLLQPGYNVWQNPLCSSGTMEFCPQEMTAGALETLPQCGDAPPLPPRKPKWVKIQQPPRVICKKKYVNVWQKICEPKLCEVTKTVDVPHVIVSSRPARIPKISYKIQVIREPALIYEPKDWTGPVLLTKPKITCEPQEVCTTFICRPKPQYIYVPPPETWCCDPQGIVTTAPNPPCPPCLFTGPLCCPGYRGGNMNDPNQTPGNVGNANWGRTPPQGFQLI